MFHAYFSVEKQPEHAVNWNKYVALPNLENGKLCAFAECNGEKRTCFHSHFRIRTKKRSFAPSVENGSFVPSPNVAVKKIVFTSCFAYSGKLIIVASPNLVVNVFFTRILALINKAL